MFVKILEGPDVGCIREMEDKAGQNLILRKQAAVSTMEAYVAFLNGEQLVLPSKANPPAPENKALGASSENKGAAVAVAVENRKRSGK